MTICIATSNFLPEAGGIATFYGHLSAVLQDAGHRVLVLMADPQSPKTKKDSRVAENGITKIILCESYWREYKNYHPYFSPGDLDAPGWIATGLAMRNWLLQNHISYGIDLIEVSDYGGLGIFLAAEPLPPVLITGHGSYTQLSRYNPQKNNAHSRVVKQLEDLSFRQADGIIVHSPLNQADLQATYTRDIFFAPAPWKEPLSIETTEKNDVVLVIGGLQKIKGALTIAEAVHRSREIGKPVNVYWIGGDTYTAPGLRKMSDYLQQEFAGIWQNGFFWMKEMKNEEVLSTIAQSAVVVLPAEWETFNYVALEAGVLNKPIILTQTTGASYLFTNEKDALIIPPGKPDELLKAIYSLLADPGKRRETGSNAGAMIKNHFVSEKIVTERINIYNQIIKQRKGKVFPGQDSLQFLKKYQTLPRKIYYRAKEIVKKILYPSSNG